MEWCKEKVLTSWRWSSVQPSRGELWFHLPCSPFPLHKMRIPSPHPPLHCFLSSLFFSLPVKYLSRYFLFGSVPGSIPALPPLKIKRLTPISITKEGTGSLCLCSRAWLFFLDLHQKKRNDAVIQKRNWSVTQANAVATAAKWVVWAERFLVMNLWLWPIPFLVLFLSSLFSLSIQDFPIFLCLRHVKPWNSPHRH